MDQILTISTTLYGISAFDFMLSSELEFQFMKDDEFLNWKRLPDRLDRRRAAILLGVPASTGFSSRLSKARHRGMLSRGS